MALWTPPVPLGFIDVRDFGARCDNTADDTAAIQAAIDSVGDNTNYRAACVYIPGMCVISDTILGERKAIELRGRNWGSQSAGDPSFGSGLRWTGTVNTKPMLRFRQGIGVIVANLRFIGHTTAGNRPTAGISFFRGTGEAQPNTMNRIEHCWFGKLLGYDAAGIYLDAGILFEGTNQNNDQTWIIDCVFHSCNLGANQTGTQNVINHYQECRWQECGTGIKTVCETLVTNSYFFGSTVCDLDLNGARVYANVFNSEGSKQLAKIRGISKLYINGDYFQITNSLGSDGRIIDAVDDNRMNIDLWNFDLRLVGYTNPAQPVFAVKALNAGAVAHKVLGMHDVTLANVPLSTAYLDVAIAGGSDTVVLQGEQQSAADASGFGLQRSFWNILKSGQATPAYERDDRTIRPPVTLTDAATIATDASLSNHFRVTLTATGRTLGNPTNLTNGQKLIYEVIQDATGSRTITTYGSKFAFGTDVTQPTLTTTANKRDFLGFIYNSAADKLYCAAVAKGY